MMNLCAWPPGVDLTRLTWALIVTHDVFTGKWDIFAPGSLAASSANVRAYRKSSRILKTFLGVTCILLSLIAVASWEVRLLAANLAPAR